MYRQTQKICSHLIKTTLNLNVAAKRSAGHSKWANIKHTKSLKDSQRSKIFTKIGTQIRVAIQLGGSPDPKKNLKLEHVIEQAKRINMPAATLNSIMKAAQTDKTQCTSHMLEIKGPGGCIILCEVFTQHLHALRQNMSSILRKNSSKFSDGGGIHSFEQKGLIIVEPLDKQKSQDETLESATEHAIEAGAEEVQMLDDGSLEFLSSATGCNSVVKALEKLNYTITSADVEYVPVKMQNLSDTELQTSEKLLEKLEELPDVVKLSDNIA